jgi:hypothetical protein
LQGVAHEITVLFKAADEGMPLNELELLLLGSLPLDQFVDGPQTVGPVGDRPTSSLARMIARYGSHRLGCNGEAGGASGWLVLGASGASQLLVGSKAEPGGALDGFDGPSTFGGAGAPS